MSITALQQKLARTRANILQSIAIKRALTAEKVAFCAPIP